MHSSSNEVCLLVHHPQNSMPSTLHDTDMPLVWKTPLPNRGRREQSKLLGATDEKVMIIQAFFWPKPK